MSVQLKVIKDLSDNVYETRFEIQSISASDTELTEAFGEPKIQIGGTITGPSDVATLPAVERALPSGFPFVQQFDAADWVDAEGLANAYITEIILRITAALTALRTMSDGFTGESVSTI